MGLSLQELHVPCIRCENTSQDSGYLETDKCLFLYSFCFLEVFSCFMFLSVWAVKPIAVTLLLTSATPWHLSVDLDDGLDLPPFCPRQFH